jgi:FkbM family methyltransferase
METEFVENYNGKFWCFKDAKVTQSLKKGSLKDRYYCISESFLRPGDVVFDVGANVGTFSVFASRFIGSTGYIIAFEPYPTTRKLLEENLHLNQIAEIVTVQSEVVSDRVSLTRARIMPTNMGGTWFVENAEPSLDNSEKEIVESTTLDRWMKEQDRVKQCDFIKIDVEGMELKVLRGAAEILSMYRPILQIEVCKPHYEKYRLKIKDLELFLESLGYRFFRKFKPFPFKNPALRRLFSLEQGSQSYDLLAIHSQSSRYPQHNSKSYQAFLFMLGEKAKIGWNALRAKYQVRTRLKTFWNLSKR